MRLRWATAAVLVSTACAFPGSSGPQPTDGWSGSGSSGGSTGSGGGRWSAPGRSGSSAGGSSTGGLPASPLVFSAYQATGSRDGKAATITRADVAFGDIDGEIVTDGDCYGVRLTPGHPMHPQRDAGAFSVGGGNAPYRCRMVDGRYACNLPKDAAFFRAGAPLSLTLEGNDEMAGLSIDGIMPPRAPEPELDLATLFDASAEVEVRWQPSAEPAQMTCLNLESLDVEGNVTAFAQCDVQDGQGRTTVPPRVMMMLDRASPRMRATLYSANAGGTDQAMAMFGAGRFVEVSR